MELHLFCTDPILCCEVNWQVSDIDKSGVGVTKPISSVLLNFIIFLEHWLYVNGLVQERRNSSALAMELRLSCTNPSIWNITFIFDLTHCSPVVMMPVKYECDSTNLILYFYKSKIIQTEKLVDFSTPTPGVSQFIWRIWCKTTKISGYLFISYNQIAAGINRDLKFLNS